MGRPRKSVSEMKIQMQTRLHPRAARIVNELARREDVPVSIVLRRLVEKGLQVEVPGYSPKSTVAA
jgi:hypothetical protein